MSRRERHQVLVERGHDTFLVTAVRRGDALRPRPRREPGYWWHPADLCTALATVVVLAVPVTVWFVLDEMVRSRLTTWKVGVFAVRRTTRRTRWKAVHRAVLDPGEDPVGAVRRLATEVREGRIGS